MAAAPPKVLGLLAVPNDPKVAPPPKEVPPDEVFPIEGEPPKAGADPKAGEDPNPLAFTGEKAPIVLGVAPIAVFSAGFAPNGEDAAFPKRPKQSLVFTLSLRSQLYLLDCIPLELAG